MPYSERVAEPEAPLRPRQHRTAQPRYRVASFNYRDGKPFKIRAPAHIYHVLTNPVYAGAYAYGKSRHSVTLDASGARKKRVRKLPRSQWPVFIPNHHQGFIDWDTYEANCARISANTSAGAHESCTMSIQRRPQSVPRSRPHSGHFRPSS